MAINGLKLDLGNRSYRVVTRHVCTCYYNPSKIIYIQDDISYTLKTLGLHEDHELCPMITFFFNST